MCGVRCHKEFTIPKQKQNVSLRQTDKYTVIHDADSNLVVVVVGVGVGVTVKQSAMVQQTAKRRHRGENQE